MMLVSTSTGAHDRLRLLSNGRLVQTLHFRLPESTGLGTLVFASDDSGESWHPHGLANGSAVEVPLSASSLPHSDVSPALCNEYGFYESAAVEVSPTKRTGSLLMVARSCTGWL
jgi:hypothetical protein